MLFAVCSDRGSPGSTTVAFALAAARGLPALVVEADPYGGDLALRCRIDGHPLPPTPTVLSLGAGLSVTDMAADGAGHRGRDLWRDGAHQLTEFVRIVPGFATAEQGAAVAWSAVTAVLETQTAPVFVDLGRIHTGSPSMPLAGAADALIAVCRGDMGSVQHLIWRLEQLVPDLAERNDRPPVVIALVVTDRRNGPRTARQVAELLAGTTVAPAVAGTGWLAWDSASVIALYKCANPRTKPLHGSALTRSAREAMRLLGTVTGLEWNEPVTTRAHLWRPRHHSGEHAAGGNSSESTSGARTVPETPESVPRRETVATTVDSAAESIERRSRPSFERLRQRGAGE